MKAYRLKLDDGRLDILTRGENRFEISEMYDHKPYIEAEVTFFDDKLEENTDACQELADNGMNLLKQFAGFSGMQGEYLLFMVRPIFHTSLYNLKVPGKFPVCNGLMISNARPVIIQNNCSDNFRTPSDFGKVNIRQRRSG